MDWKALGASLAVAAACVGAFGWMLADISTGVNQNTTELHEIHEDIGEIRANQERILDAMKWRGGMPAACQ